MSECGWGFMVDGVEGMWFIWKGDGRLWEK